MAWQKGALSNSYLQTTLDKLSGQMSEIENRDLAPPGWRAVWDRYDLLDLSFYFIYSSYQKFFREIIMKTNSAVSKFRDRRYLTWTMKKEPRIGKKCPKIALFHTNTHSRKCWDFKHGVESEPGQKWRETEGARYQIRVRVYRPIIYDICLKINATLWSFLSSSCLARKRKFQKTWRREKKSSKWNISISLLS